MSDNTTKGALYLVGTPIGNLEDISFRAIRILKEVDLIAAEDTRQTRKLLNHFEINNSLTSYHEHNKREKGQKLIEELISGKDIALVTDAGMPGISDPGEDLVKLAINEGIAVIPIPGPTAAVTALVISGLETDRFVFEGFLPRKNKELKQRLEFLAQEQRTIILYESPHRLLKILGELEKGFGSDRKIAVIRELTKKFEETIKGSINEVIEIFGAKAVKGEFVIIIEGVKKDLKQADEELDEEQLVQQVDRLILQGMTKKEAFKEVAKVKGIPKREIYDLYLKKK